MGMYQNRSYMSAFPRTIAPLLPITVNCALPGVAFEARADAGRLEEPSLPALIMAFARSDTYVHVRQFREDRRVLTSICPLDVIWDTAPIKTL